MKSASNLQTAIAIAFLVAGAVHGQTNSSIVQSGGLKCSTMSGSGTFAVLSWSVGAAVTGASAGSGAAGNAVGRPQLGPLNIVKSFDECGPALFQTLVTGTRLQTLTLSDLVVPSSSSRETKTTASPVTIKLDNVLVNQYVVNDGNSNGAVESISFTYERITITNSANGSRFCWDATVLKSCS